MAFENIIADLQRAHDSQVAELHMEIHSLQKKLAKARTISRSSDTDTILSADVSSARDRSGSDPVNTQCQLSPCGTDGPIISKKSYVLYQRSTRDFKPDSLRKNSDSLRTNEYFKPEERKGLASWRGYIERPAFEAAVSVLIVLSCVVTALQLQFDGMTKAHSLGIRWYKSGHEVWNGYDGVLQSIDVIFGIIFTLEFVFRAAILRFDIIWSIWNWLDFIVVVLSIMDMLMGGNSNDKGMRLLRLAKMARAVRTLKLNKFMSALHLLLVSIHASISTLFWALIVIVAAQFVAALFMCQLLSQFYDSPHVSRQDVEEVFGYFGTFSRSLITIFEILLANWAKPCRVCVRILGEEYGFLIVGYRCICGFAVLSVVQAVFLQQTMKVMSQDTEVMLLEKDRSEKHYAQRLRQLFASLNVTDASVLTMESMSKTLDDDDVRLHCFILGIDPQDLEDVFHLIDEGGGITEAEFFEAAQQIRRQARTIDMARVLANVRKIGLDMARLQDVTGHLLSMINQIRSPASQAHLAMIPSPSSLSNSQEELISPSSPCYPNGHEQPIHRHAVQL